MAVQALENKYRNYFDRCQHCDADLMYNEGDVLIGAFGFAFVKCPVCGNNADVYDYQNDFRLTLSNLEYPKHFHKNDGVKLSDEEIKKYIDQAAKNVEEGSFSRISTGDTTVIVMKYDGECDIVVAKNYEHVSFFQD